MNYIEMSCIYYDLIKEVKDIESLNNHVNDLIIELDIKDKDMIDNIMDRSAYIFECDPLVRNEIAIDIINYCIDASIYLKSLKK